MSQTQPIYSDAQANEILRTAVRLASPPEISFDELVAAACEIGLKREDLAEAERRYAESTTEAGQQAQFRQMQDHQFHLSAFHTALVGLIGTALIFIDLRDWFLILFGALLVGIATWLLYRYRQLHNENSTKYRLDYQRWQKKKDLWLRPEEAQEIVDTMVKNRGGALRPFRSDLEKELRSKFGYDARRAKEVLASYLREHPEMESEILL